VAILVNPKPKKPKKTVQLAHLFAKVGAMKKNRKRNPLLVQNRKRNGRAATKKNRKRNGSGAKKNPLLVQNPYLVQNPLLIANGRKRNPLLVQNRKRRKPRRNPLALGSLAGTAMSVGTNVIAGAVVGSVPHYYIVKAIYGKLPAILRPAAFSIVGGAASALVAALAPKFRYRDEVVTALAVGGGAIDGYRFLTAKMGALAGDYDYAGEADFSADEYGDDYGDAGEYGEDMGYPGDPPYAPLGRMHEYAAADLMDAEYSGDDLSGEEREVASYGRGAYARKYKPTNKQGRMAGQPGVRWGWLIYWLGFDNFQKIAKAPESTRRDAIHRARHAALQAARQALTVGSATTVVAADKAGLMEIAA
jgi:hypothetical protein